MFLILSIRPNIRCQFHRETLRFKWIKLYISNMPYLHALLSSFYLLYVTNIQIATLRGDIRLPQKKFRSPWKTPSIAFSSLWLCRIHRGAIIRNEKDYFVYSQVTRNATSSFSSGFLTGSPAGLKSGDEKDDSFARAYRTLAAARTAVDVLRTRKTRKSGADGRRDNEIEMAKADHRIGWLNRGWRSRSRRTRPRGLIRAATALSARASLAPRN